MKREIPLKAGLSILLDPQMDEYFILELVEQNIDNHLNYQDLRYEK